ncbi:hypothetical protein GCM10027098_21380 [Bowmanella dokdonensis]
MAAAGEADDLPRSYSPDQVKEDFAQLYKGLQQAHYDLFANLSKPNYDQHFEEFMAQIDAPMTALLVKTHFQKFVALGKVAHARIDFPAEEYSAFREAGGKTLPLYLSVTDEGVYVNEYYGAHPEINPYDRLISVNGQPVQQWLAPLYQHLSADNPLIAATLLEFRLPALLWLEHGERPAYELTLEKPDGRKLTLTQPTLSKAQQQLHSADKEMSEQIDWDSREAEILEHNIAYLRPGPFYNNSPEAVDIWDNRQFKAFIDQAFMSFAKAGARALLIDLRSNPGGTNSFSDHMLAWIADRPFKFASDFRVKVSPQAQAANRARLATSQDKNDISHKLDEFYQAQPMGTVFSFPLPLAQPREGERFSGEVYVLIDRYSYSNAVSVAAIVKDYGFATLLGEKTADLATTYGAMEEFKLNHTGIQVGFPKAHIIRPNGEMKPDGVAPDVVIDTPMTPDASQRVLQAALDHIQHALQTSVN